MNVEVFNHLPRINLTRRGHRYFYCEDLFKSLPTEPAEIITPLFTMMQVFDNSGMMKSAENIVSTPYGNDRLHRGDKASVLVYVLGVTQFHDEDSLIFEREKSHHRYRLEDKIPFYLIHLEDIEEYHPLIPVSDVETGKLSA